MKMYWGVKVWIHTFLTSVLDGGTRSTSCPNHFNPRVRAPGIPWIGCKVVPIASLDPLVKRRNPITLARNQTPLVQPVA
jgi:hypothetical protein